MIINTHNSA